MIFCYIWVYICIRTSTLVIVLLHIEFTGYGIDMYDGTFAISLYTYHSKVKTEIKWTLSNVIKG